MADQILDLITRRQSVSFAELDRHIEGFKGGEYKLVLGERNIVLWQGITKAGINALQLCQIGPFCSMTRQLSWDELG
jgi:hypothetical protein